MSNTLYLLLLLVNLTLAGLLGWTIRGAFGNIFLVSDGKKQNRWVVSVFIFCISCCCVSHYFFVNSKTGLPKDLSSLPAGRYQVVSEPIVGDQKYFLIIQEKKPVFYRFSKGSSKGLELIRSGSNSFSFESPRILVKK